VPGGKEWNDGDECGDKTGEVQLFVNGERVSGDPKRHRMNDRDQIVLAFAPRDADIPKVPPSTPNLDNLSDVPGGTSSSTLPGSPTTTPGEVPPSTAPGDTTATTAAPPGDPTATTAAPPPTDATTTTAAP
jgi:hypothetical protein